MPTVREIAESRLQNVEVAIEAARAVGLPIHIAFALLDMESEGRNFFGSDSGGMFKGETVTQAKFEAMEKAVAAGKPSNGVGPLQITYRGFFPQARAQGLKLWEPYDNMLFGFKLIKGYLDRYPNDLVKVGRLYNGKESYGITFKRVVGEWVARLKDAEDTPVATWHLAPSLVQLQKDLDAEFGENRPNDGTIGDTAHAARSSEHNPDNDPDPMPHGAVSAIDIYTDANGKTWITDAEFDKLLAIFKKDSRVWYVIHKKFIYSRTHGWKKTAYTGSNPHNTHIHLSLMQTKAAHDDTSSWKISGVKGGSTPTPDPKPTGKDLPNLKFGDSDKVLVPFLKRYFFPTPPNQDAKFGSGTRQKVVEFQKKNHLRVDGVVGTETWKKIVASGTKLPAGYKAP